VPKYWRVAGTDFCADFLLSGAARGNFRRPRGDISHIFWLRKTGRAAGRENVCEYFARKYFPIKPDVSLQNFSREIFADIFALGRAARKI